MISFFKRVKTSKRGHVNASFSGISFSYKILGSYSEYWRIWSKVIQKPRSRISNKDVMNVANYRLTDTAVIS